MGFWILSFYIILFFFPLFFCLGCTFLFPFFFLGTFLKGSVVLAQLMRGVRSKALELEDVELPLLGSYKKWP